MLHGTTGGRRGNHTLRGLNYSLLLISEASAESFKLEIDPVLYTKMKHYRRENLAFTLDCRSQYCMLHGTTRGRRVNNTLRGLNYGILLISEASAESFKLEIVPVLYMTMRQYEGSPDTAGGGV